MMRKVILLLASMAAAVLLATGVTLAESTIDQQYTTVDSSEVVYQNQLDAAQTFTAGKPGNLDKVSVGVFPQTDPPGSLTAEIRNVDSSGKPSTTVLGNGTLDGSTITAERYSLVELTISLTQPVPITEGTKYALVLSSPGHYAWGGGGTIVGSPKYGGGNAWVDYGDGTGWHLQGNNIDFMFRTYVSPPDTNQPSVSETLGDGGGTVSTGSTPTSSAPVAASITSPVGGEVSIKSSSTTGTSPTGYSLFGQQIDITAPQASTTSPLSLTFTLDPSIVPSGVDETNVQLFRDGSQIADCTDPSSGKASPDPCISKRTKATNGDIQITVLSSHASKWNFAQDTTSPQLASNNPTSPANKATKVKTAKVSATFNEYMKAATLAGTSTKSTPGNFKLEQVKPTGNVVIPGKVTCGDTTTPCTTATFTVDSASLKNGVLPAGAYKATLTTGVTDQANNALAKAYSWQFTSVGPK